MNKSIFVAAVTASVVFSLPKVASACTPYGIIGENWNTFQSVLGPCTDDEHDDNVYDTQGASGRIETFQYGWSEWHAGNSYAAEVHGSIGQAWMGRYGGPSVIGFPITNQTEAAQTHNPVVDQRNIFSDDAGDQSELYWGSQCTNSDYVCGIWGRILVVWRQYGDYGDWYPNSESYVGIGWPTNDVHDDSNHAYALQNFQGGSIAWNKSNGHSCLYWDSTLYYSEGADCPSFPPN